MKGRERERIEGKEGKRKGKERGGIKDREERGALKCYWPKYRYRDMKSVRTWNTPATLPSLSALC